MAEPEKKEQIKTGGDSDTELGRSWHSGLLQVFSTPLPYSQLIFPICLLNRSCLRAAGVSVESLVSPQPNAWISLNRCFWHGARASAFTLLIMGQSLPDLFLEPATMKKSEPHSSPCDFLPHSKSALWSRPTSGLLVPLSHPPSPVPVPFTPSRFSLCPSGLPIL